MCVVCLYVNINICVFSSSVQEEDLGAMNMLHIQILVLKNHPQRKQGSLEERVTPGKQEEHQLLLQTRQVLKERSDSHPKDAVTTFTLCANLT